MGTRFRVGTWQVDPSSRTLSRDGESIMLSPRAMDVLVHLVEHPGEVVPGGRLIEAYWPRSVTSPNAIQKVMTELRHALEGASEDPAYIETIPKRGYRLIAAVEPPHTANGFAQSENGTTTIGPNDEALSANGVQRAVERPHWTQTRRMLVSLAALVGLIVAGVVLTQRSGFFLEHSAQVPPAKRTLAVLRFRNVDRELRQRIPCRGNPQRAFD